MKCLCVLKSQLALFEVQFHRQYIIYSRKPVRGKQKGVAAPGPSSKPLWMFFTLLKISVEVEPLFTVGNLTEIESRLSLYFSHTHTFSSVYSTYTSCVCARECAATSTSDQSGALTSVTEIGVPAGPRTVARGAFHGAAGSKETRKETS